MKSRITSVINKRAVVFYGNSSIKFQVVLKMFDIL